MHGNCQIPKGNRVLGCSRSGAGFLDMSLKVSRWGSEAAIADLSVCKLYPTLDPETYPKPCW